jgi:RNA polymerase sigma-70 factor, ECF subfamily
MRLTRVGEEREPDALFNQLVRDHRPVVERLCRLLLRNDSEAEDAVQQTFLLAYQSLVSGTRPRLPRAWLFTIARHECWARLDHRRERALPETQPSEGLDPSEQAILNTKLKTLIAGIGRLPARQRQVLVLREFGGFSYRQLAATMGISESAVDALLIRARRTLRRGLFTLLPLPYLFSPSRLLQRALRRVADETNRLRASAFAHAQATAVAAATTVVPLAATAALAATGAATARDAHPLAGPPMEGLRTPTSGSNVEYRVTMSEAIHAKHFGSASPATAPADSIEVLESGAGKRLESVEPGSSRRSAARDAPILAKALQSQPAEEPVSEHPERSSIQSAANGPTPKTPALPATTPPAPAPSQADKPSTKAAQATPAPPPSDSPPADRRHDPPDQGETLTKPITDPDHAGLRSGDEPTTPASPDTTPAAPTTEPVATTPEVRDGTNAEANQPATTPTESSGDTQQEHGRPGQRGTVDGVTPGSDPAPPAGAGTAGGPSPPEHGGGRKSSA